LWEEARIIGAQSTIRKSSFLFVVFLLLQTDNRVCLQSRKPMRGRGPLYRTSGSCWFYKKERYDEGFDSVKVENKKAGLDIDDSLLPRKRRHRKPWHQPTNQLLWICWWNRSGFSTTKDKFQI